MIEKMIKRKSGTVFWRIQYRFLLKEDNKNGKDKERKRNGNGKERV